VVCVAFTAMDLILRYEDGTSATILSQITARTDLSSLSDSSTGIIEELKEDLNPSVLQTEGGTVSTDGAWKRIETDVGGDVTQWGCALLSLTYLSYSTTISHNPFTLFTDTDNSSTVLPSRAPASTAPSTRTILTT
jgi:hypothetical protein